MGEKNAGLLRYDNRKILSHDIKTSSYSIEKRQTHRNGFTIDPSSFSRRSVFFISFSENSLSCTAQLVVFRLREIKMIVRFQFSSLYSNVNLEQDVSII